MTAVHSFLHCSV